MSINQQQYDQINTILAAWNPIGVDDHIADEEYKRYIPRIATITDEQTLTRCLQDILVNELNLPYDPNNPDHVADLQDVVARLLSVTKPA